LDDQKLISLIEYLQIVAAFVVAIGVAAEFGLSYWGRPIHRRIETAREAEIARLRTEAADAKATAATANEGTAKANERAQALEVEAAQQKERAARAELELQGIQQKIQPRRLSDAQKRALIESLRAAEPKGPISMNCMASDNEGHVFASDWAEVFNKAGWPTSAIKPDYGRREPDRNCHQGPAP
jgi:hypothetical protein